MKALSFCIALLLLPALVAADISGSSVELELPADGQAAIGAMVQFRFKVTNASTDNNWIANLHFTLPEGCEVARMDWDDSEAHNDWVFYFAGIGTNVASFIDDRYVLWGEVPPGGEYGWFDVEARIAEDCDEGPVLVHWLLEGDGWGAPPHELDDELPLFFLAVPVESASWSTVKSSYRPEE